MMTGEGLASAIKTAIAEVPEGGRDFDAMWNAIATAIVTYIQTNAVVSSNVAVTSVSGVTTGAGVSGPGTGTATGTIS